MDVTVVLRSLYELVRLLFVVFFIKEGAAPSDPRGDRTGNLGVISTML